MAPLDLVSPVPAGEARAGRIDDEAALFAGIAAEGRVGDFKIYNDRVRFVIQGARAGAGYLPEGGGVIDADIARPDGEPGRDAIEEWATQLGLGRVVVPDRVEVVSDGRAGGAAVVRVWGHEGPLGLLEGALEAPGFVRMLGLEVVTDYVLEPDSDLLEVRTTVLAEADAVVPIGDMVLGAEEVLSAWVPGVGFGADRGGPRPWAGYMGDRNDVAYALVAPPDAELSVTGVELLTELASMVIGFSGDNTLTAGETATWTRYYAVGRDMAAVTDAVQALRGVATTEVSGVVEADGPVAGARVAISVDGAPYTVAATGADGSFTARVPEGAAVETLAVGRGPALFSDLPAGAVSLAPYCAPSVRDEALASLTQGAPGAPMVDGYGVGTPSDPLRLVTPGTLVVNAADGGPFTLRVGFTGPDPEVDRALVPGRPDGLAAAGWSRDGTLEIPVEPGTYALVVHRGPRFELFEQTVTVTSGEVTEVTAALPAAFEHPGWVLGDPHQHAAPSPDAAISMEDRVVVAAAVGLQVHFGTDHDNLADYRPLVTALGLSDRLMSVVSDEVSPPLRGHMNIYPVEPDPDRPAAGAWAWWVEIPDSTEALVDRLRELYGDGFVLQSNHPLDSGVPAAAGWTEGRIKNPEYWTDRLEAVEVLNSGDHDLYVPFWLDLVARGRTLTPVGVSDSHSHFGGSVGLSATWVEVGTDDPTATTDVDVSNAIRAGRTQASLGPFLALDPLPASTVAPGTVLEVEARGASWVRVDRIRLLRDGVEEAVVDGPVASFTLDPAQDAIYAVIAEGDTPMTPVSGRTPWALAGPWKVDVGGDGWTAPLPPLTLD